MPTIILLDVSLSMARPVGQVQDEEKLLRRSLASTAITNFLDVIVTNAKLEFCALVNISLNWLFIYIHRKVKLIFTNYYCTVSL